MLVKNKNLIYIIVLLVFLQVGLFVFLYKNNFKVAYYGVIVDHDELLKFVDKDLPRHYAYFSSIDFYDAAFENGVSNNFASEAMVYGGILPHHLIVKDKIASFFLGLEKKNYENIVLIGPNHFDTGDTDIVTSRAIWETPYGELRPNLKLIKTISALAGASTNERSFIKEHSISGLVAFIKKVIPTAKFTPIILKEKTSELDCDLLVKKILTELNPEKTLVLASVDFSHYLPASIADFHDQSSRDIIESFDYKLINKMEIDSPASIYTVLKYLDAIGAEQANLLATTNSGRLSNNFDSQTTSHGFYYFSKGAMKRQRLITALFFGDLMIDRHVGEKINKQGLDYLFEEIKGDENRFFRGIDLIGTNLEGVVTDKGAHYPSIMAYDFAFVPEIVAGLKKYNINFFNLANNHFFDQGERGIIETRKNLTEQGFSFVGCKDRKVGDCSTKVVKIKNQKIGMAGFSMVYGLLDEKKAVQKVRDLSGKSEFQIVNVHWGREYEHFYNKVQTNFAHQMIDAGADVIIGHHPHVVQGIEIYKGKAIFYSLGNFIFDQYFSRDTQIGLGAGMVVSSQEISFYLFPLISKLSQPKLMQGDEKQKFFDSLVEWSKLDQKYSQQIKNGRITIKN